MKELATLRRSIHSFFKKNGKLPGNIQSYFAELALEITWYIILMSVLVNTAA